MHSLLESAKSCRGCQRHVSLSWIKQQAMLTNSAGSTRRTTLGCASSRTHRQGCPSTPTRATCRRPAVRSDWDSRRNARAGRLRLQTQDRPHWRPLEPRTAPSHRFALARPAVRGRVQAARRRVDIRIIQLMLAHASIQQTQRYLNMTDEERRGLEVSWNNNGGPLRLASRG